MKNKDITVLNNKKLLYKEVNYHLDWLEWNKLLIVEKIEIELLFL